MADEVVVSPLEDEVTESAGLGEHSPVDTFEDERTDGSGLSTFDVDNTSKSDKDTGRMSPAQTGWLKVKNVVDLATTIRLDESELLAKHADKGEERPSFVIDPRSTFWKVWCLVNGAVIGLLLFLVPFELAFVCMDAINLCKTVIPISAILSDAEATATAGSSGSEAFHEDACRGWDGPPEIEQYLRLVMDMTILIDFFIHFVLGFSYYDLKKRRPVYIWNPKTICLHYLSSPGFLYDLAGAMPIDTVLRLEATRTSYILAQIASILRLLRLRAISEVTQPLQQVVARAAIFFPPIDPFSKLLMMIMSIVAITHFMACLLYFTGHPYFDDAELCNLADGRDTCGWVATQGWTAEMDGAELLAKYVTSLYYASTQITTVGFGDISAKTTMERLFSVFSQMFGGFVFGYVLGNISTLLAKENLALSNHSSYMETLHHFMLHEGIPATLHRRVMAYMEHRYPERNIYDENRLYSELTPSLRGEIAFHRFGSVIENLHVFKDLKYQTSSLLCSRIAMCSFVDGDVITNQGSLADRMFVLKQGVVHIFDNCETLKLALSQSGEKTPPRTEVNGHDIDVGDATLIKVVGSGEALAELAAVMPFVQPYTCKCVEYCLVCTLQRRHILEIAGVHDELADALAMLLKKNRKKVEELCLEGSTFETVLSGIDMLKDAVHTDVDAIQGGGISAGVEFGASAMDQYTNSDIVADIYKVTNTQRELAIQVQQGFAAINARLDEIQKGRK